MKHPECLVFASVSIPYLKFNKVLWYWI